MIYPPDLSKTAVRERDNLDIPEPDFEVDAVLLTPSSIPVRAEAKAEIAPEYMVKAKAARKGEPVFLLNLLQSQLPEDLELPAYSTLSYWVTFSGLSAGEQPKPAGGDFPLRLSEATRGAMMVWWDQHAEEIEAVAEYYAMGFADAENWDVSYRDFDREDGTPRQLARERIRGETSHEALYDLLRSIDKSDASPRYKALYEKEAIRGLEDALTEKIAELGLDSHVAAELQRNRFPARQVGLNADWSVRAWYLGTAPGARDRGPNRTEGGVYLLDLESGDNEFEVVRRYYDDRENDIESLFSGTYQDAIARARRELNLPFFVPR